MTQSGNAAAAKRYFDSGLAVGDYFVKGGSKDGSPEEPGRWGGKLAHRLGLKGPVNRETFQRLCDNQLPDGSGSLTPRTRANRRVGYDLNFHCPKSVSVLYALTGDPSILDAFRQAANETMEELELDAEARMRAKGASGNRATGNLIWAEFTHTTARPVGGIPDPHLHIHFFTFNATFDPVEARLKAGEFATIKRNASYYEAAFHARLARLLANGGYEIEKVGRYWEVAAVPKSVLNKFSNRTAEIEAVAAALGITDAKAKAALGARTRKRKSQSISWKETQASWRTRLTADELAAVRGAKNGKATRNSSVDVAREALSSALNRCLVRTSLVRERVLLEEALRDSVGRVSIEGLKDELSRLSVIRREVEGVRYITTEPFLNEEQKLFDLARSGRGSCPPLMEESELASLKIVESERELLRQVLLSPDRVLLLRLWSKETGASVRDATASAIATAGRKFASVAPGSLGSAEFPRGSVIWVEKADGLKPGDALALFQKAKGLDARVVLLGDAYETGSASKQGLLRLLEIHAGLRSVERMEYGRHKAERRKAAKDFTQGKLAEAIEKLERLGAIQQETPSGLPGAVAREYERMTKAKGATLVIAPGLTEQLNSAVREHLRSTRIIKRGRTFDKFENLRFTNEQLKDALSYSRGQVVLFFKSVKGFKAGSRYTVIGRDPFGNVLARKGAFIEALPLKSADCFAMFRRSTIEIGKGDRIRITLSGRTGNEQFGPEKLLSKRGRAIRLSNMTMIGLKVPDRRYRVPKNSIHQVKGFTLQGDIKLENGWVLPKSFGHLDYGYCMGSMPNARQSIKNVLLVSTAESRRDLDSLSEVDGVESVKIITDNKASFHAAKAKASSSGDKKRASTYSAKSIFAKRAAGGERRRGRETALTEQSRER